MRSLNLAFVVMAVGIGIGIPACGSGNGSSEYGTPAPTPAPVTPASSGGTTLTVMNFLNWCSVAINGGTASTGATVSASVPAGSMATVVATPASDAFQIGTNPWFGVDQNDGGAAAGTDVGSGTNETSTAVVTIGTGATQCVSVCCQEPGNSPLPCPATNPCP